MTADYSKIQFTFKPNAEFRNNSQLFIDCILIFDCNDDAAMIIESAIRHTRKSGSFTVAEIMADLKPIKSMENLKDPEASLLSILEYLHKCQILTHQHIS